MSGVKEARRIGFAIPGDVNATSGGYVYDRELLARLPAEGVEIALLGLPAGFPAPDRATLSETERLLSTFEGPLLIDGLAFGAFPPELSRRIGHRAVALLHHPLCLEDGLSGAAAADLEARERAAVGAARGVIVTSSDTADTVARLFDASRDEIVIAEPGVRIAAQAAMRGGATEDNPPIVITVGATIPRKRHPLLIETFAQLRDLPWRLRIIGPIDVDGAETDRLRSTISRYDLGARVKLAGAIGGTDLIAAYGGADLFVAASAYEGFGMAAADAVSHGLPIAVTPGGASRRRGASGVILEPEDPTSIAALLRPILSNPQRRREMGAASWAAASGLTRWSDTARIVSQALKRFLL